MGNPIALFAGTAPAVTLLASPPEDASAVSFELTLGAALAAGAVATIPAVVTTPLPLLELVLDGEWLPDEACASGDPEADPELPAAAVSVVADSFEPADPDPDGKAPEVLVLGTNLENWLTAVGRRPMESRRRVDGDPDPATVSIDDAAEAVRRPESERDPKPEARIAVAEPAEVRPPDNQFAAPADVTPPPIPVVGLQAPIPPSTSLYAAALAAPKVVWEGEPSVEVGTPVVRRPPADAPSRGFSSPALDTGRRVLSFDGMMDGEELLQLRQRSEPLIEVGGFSFPMVATEEQPAAPVRRADEPAWIAKPERQAAEVVTWAGAELEGPVAARTDAPRPNQVSLDRHGQIPRVVVHQMEQGDREKESARSQGGSREERPLSRPAIPQEGTTASAGFQIRSAPVSPGAGYAAPVPEREPVDAVRTTEPTPLDRMARRVDHLTLDLKDEDGAYGSIRVSVSGPSVRATILPTDPAMADRLNQEIRQLKQSLADRGFSEPQVRVESPKTTSESEPRSWIPSASEVVADQGPADRRTAQRQPGDDDRRDRWTSAREQRQDEQRRQDRPRHSRPEKGEPQS